MYAKIDSETNFLRIATNNYDGSFRPIEDFVIKSPGEYYTYYIDNLTPDSAKNSEHDSFVANRISREVLADTTLLLANDIESVLTEGEKLDRDVTRSNAINSISSNSTSIMSITDSYKSLIHKYIGKY